MNRFITSFTFLVGVVFVAPNIATAAVVGTDDASQSVYDDGWDTGDDGSSSGDAFGTWGLNSGGGAGGFGGFFVGDSTSLSGGAGADINSSGESFGFFANPQGTGAFASATRGFNGVLAVGDTFTLDIAANFRNGAKGINLFDGGTQIFNFNIGGDDYVVNSAATGNGTIGDTYSPDTAFNLSFTQTTAGGGTWTIGRSGGVMDLDTGTYTGVASSFELYISATDGGDANNLFANNLSITSSAVAVPEPSALALLVVGPGAVLLRRRPRGE